MTIFQIGDKVTPKKNDKKLGELHGKVFIITNYDEVTGVVYVELPGYGPLQGHSAGGFVFNHTAEGYWPSRFILIEKNKPDTIEDRIKKLYRKCKTTKHWG